jgi:hypothetical protein
MIRRVLNLLRLVSLLLFVAACVVSVRSDRALRKYWYSPGSTWAVGVGRMEGVLCAYHVSGWPYRFASGVGSVRGHFGFNLGFLQPVPTYRYEYGGFGYVRLAPMTSDYRMHVVIGPPWFPFAVTAALPATWGLVWLASARRRRARLNRRCCPLCGYDLRATPEKCLECGTPPA